MEKWFWYFALYSFFGFLLEVLFAQITHNPKRDRKCFYVLPLCPVYGLGAILIVALPQAIWVHPGLLAICGAGAATGAEYGMGLFYEKVLRVKFWDYSDLPANIGGKVCLLFSLLWCVLGLGLVYGVHPLLGQWVSHIPAAVTHLAALLLCLDAGWTVYLLRRNRTTDVLLWYRKISWRRGTAPTQG